jgi:hypothetical protein
MNWTGFWILLKNQTRTMPWSSCKNGMEGSPENARTTQHKYVGYTHAHGHYTYTWATLGIKKYAHKHWPWCLYWSNKQGGASQCGLAIYIKKCLKAKEELWKFKYFTMQKPKRNQNPSRYYNSITNLKFQPKPNISSFKNLHREIDLLPGGPKSLKLLYSIMNLNTISLGLGQGQ